MSFRPTWPMTAIILCALLACGHPVCAAIVNVDNDAPGDPDPGSTEISDPLENGSVAHPFDGIQEAIDASEDGDEIVIFGGTYREQIDLGNRSLLIRSNGGAVILRGIENTRSVVGSGDTTNVVMRDLTFRGPLVGLGGGIAFAGGAVEFHGCRFDSIEWSGAGAGLSVLETVVTATNCTWTENFAVQGGGLSAIGGTISLTNCRFEQNTAEQGGALMFDQVTSLELSRCQMIGNVASANGGAMALVDTNASIVNCRLSGNAAKFNGGAIYAFDGSDVLLTSGSVVGNSAGFGGGGLYSQAGSELSLVGSIAWSNQPDQILFTDVQALVTSSNIQGGWPGAGNIASNPQFVDEAIGDLRLQFSSPCVDTGADAASGLAGALDDVAGKPRFVDAVAGSTIVDMGAYEFQLHPNDRCIDALELDAGVITVDTTGATTDANTNACLESPDTWYVYEAPCDGTATIALCSSAEASLAIWDTGCPGAPDAPIACSLNPCGGVSFPVDDGATYRVQISVVGTGTLTVTDPPCLPPPPNDNCGTATLINIGLTPFSTLGATTDGPDMPGLCQTDGFSQIDRDTWYRHFSTCSDEITVSLCDSDFDSKLAVYFVACPGATGSPFACNDNSDCGLGASVTFVANPGDIYRIRIGGVNGATGSGTIEMICEPSCPTDINHNGETDINDLLAVIVDWGTEGSFGGDVNQSGLVDVEDLIEMILAWGPCDE